MRWVWNFLIDLAMGRRKLRLWLVIIVLAIFSTAIPTYLLFAKALPALKKAPVLANTLVDRSVPDDFALEIKDGQASINQVEPFFITVNLSDISEFEFFVNATFKEFKKTNISKLRLLTVDTKATYKDFDRYQTWVLVTKDSAIYSAGSGIEIKQLKDEGDKVITKQDIRDLVLNSSTLESVVIVEVLIWLAPIFLFILHLLGYPMSLLFWAFLLWVIGRIIRVNPGWKNLFHVCTALLFVPCIVSDFGWLLGENGVYFIAIVQSVGNLIAIVGGYLVLKGVQRRYAQV